MKTTGRTAITKALDESLKDPRVLLIGEDIKTDGCFYCERGLSEKYPDQVISTPISEAGFTGLGIGLALAGFKPVVTYMFFDFILLAMDQIVNHALVFNSTYKPVPILLRATCGAGYRYGPTHSQDWSDLFRKVPGLKVVVPETVSDYYHKLKDEIFHLSSPVLFVEKKAMYEKVGRILD